MSLDTVTVKNLGEDLGKLAFPNSNTFKKKNKIASLDVNGKLEISQAPYKAGAGIRISNDGIISYTGGGDAHNKGYFTTVEELKTTYPQAEPGDFAVVGSTDTIWVWDIESNNWVDTDTKGQVSSVNGVNPDASGNVTITSTNIPDIASTYATKIGLTTIDAAKANIDATNIANNNLTSWKNKLGINTIETTLNTKQDKITTSTEISITPTASQVATSITGALAKHARVIVTPNILNSGAMYIKESSTYSSINPIYPDPTNNVYEFTNMQNVKVFADNVGDSLDLVIEYRG